ncbi:MAG: hypothetical protein ABH865_01370 [Candidatus Omnitrophota bacterium]|nr:hypothetical protein [Candidatus Omnitrophota bacterium]
MSKKITIFFTKKMQLIVHKIPCWLVKKFHNRWRCISLGINHSGSFGMEHFFGIPHRYPKFPVEILAAALRAENTNAFSGFRRKANALVEYSVVLMIVAGAVYGMFTELKRTVQMKIKKESDQYIGHGHGLEWNGESLSIITSNSDYQRREIPGGEIVTQANADMGSVVLTAPVPSFQGYSPMMHKQAGLHVQDAAQPAPKPDNPSQSNDEPSEEQGVYEVGGY